MFNYVQILENIKKNLGLLPNMNHLEKYFYAEQSEAEFF